jgi:hypothetical protein
MSDAIKTRAINDNRIDHEHTDFGLVDDRGRKIGYAASYHEVDYVEAPAEGHWYCTKPVGHYFYARVHATRNGASYGSVNPEIEGASVEELRKVVAKKLAAAKKRYAKQFAAANAPKG